MFTFLKHPNGQKRRFLRVKKKDQTLLKRAENRSKTAEIPHQTHLTSFQGDLEQLLIFRQKPPRIARYRPLKIAIIGDLHYKRGLKRPKIGRKRPKYPTKLI